MTRYVVAAVLITMGLLLRRWAASRQKSLEKTDISVASDLKEQPENVSSTNVAPDLKEQPENVSNTNSELLAGRAKIEWYATGAYCSVNESKSLERYYSTASLGYPGYVFVSIDRIVEFEGQAKFEGIYRNGQEVMIKSYCQSTRGDVSEHPQTARYRVYATIEKKTSTALRSS
jgi:hypothetical protein